MCKGTIIHITYKERVKLAGRGKRATHDEACGKINKYNCSFHLCEMFELVKLFVFKDLCLQTHIRGEDTHCLW